MMTEKVTVTVKGNGNTYRKTVDIRSDGSYVKVQREVEKLVAHEFKFLPVVSFSWQYA